MEREVQGYLPNDFSSRTSEELHLEAQREARIKDLDFLQHELKNGVIPNSSVTFNASNELLVGGLLTENTQDK